MNGFLEENFFLHEVLVFIRLYKTQLFEPEFEVRTVKSVCHCGAIK